MFLVGQVNMPDESIPHYLNSVLYSSSYHTIIALGESNVGVEGVYIPKLCSSYELKRLNLYQHPEELP